MSSLLMTLIELEAENRMFELVSQNDVTEPPLLIEADDRPAVTFAESGVWITGSATPR